MLWRAENPHTDRFNLLISFIENSIFDQRKQMDKVEANQYKEFIPWAKSCSSNQVYPLSIAEGRQSGDIFVDNLENPNSVLFWHYCGLAYISGRTSESLLEEITADICTGSSRRLLFITDDAPAINWLLQNHYEISRRIEYSYGGDSSAVTEQTDIDIRKIDENNLHLINGRIIPSFSWEDKLFLKNGFGFAAFDNDKYCGVAFSSAISSAEVDIGVDVIASYRCHGIATALVHKMCDEIISQGKKPVWAHAEKNTASMHTAIKCGFIQKKTNYYSLLTQKRE